MTNDEMALYTGISRLQSACKCLAEAVEKEDKGAQEAIRREGEQLKRERQSVEEKEQQIEILRKRLKLFTGTPENTLALDVGGQKFVTTRETLVAVSDTLFTVLLSGRFEVDTVDGAIKLDRDPTYFSYILNYLRSCREGGPDASLFSLRGVSPLSASCIAQEAKFYGLESLKTMAINCTSLIVSKEVDTKYSSLKDALQDAKNGDRIVVVPGTYFEESIEITKEVEICGEGPRDKIVIVTTNGTPTASIANTKARLVNLSLREMSRFGVCILDIKGKSEVVIDDCDLTTRQEANAINISDSAVVTVCRSRIHGARGSAVFLRDHATVTLQSNELVNLGCAGLQARHESSFTLSGNMIHHAAFGGIDAKDCTRGTVTNNSITHCKRGAIILQDDAQLQIEGNVITKNEFGIRCFSPSKIVGYRSNRVYDNITEDLQGFSSELANTSRAASAE